MREEDVLETAAEIAANQLNQDLEATKTAMHEMSEAQGRIVDLGTLSGGQNEHLWNQAGISLKRRVESGEVTDVEVEEGAARLPQSFVPVAKGAAKRCIDGSSSEGYDDNDPAQYGKGLGPQIQGGTAGEAVAMRMLKGFEDDEDATMLGDIETQATEHESEFAAGDHTDDHANEEKSGCGQVDGQPRKMPMYNDEEKAPILQNTADTIMSLDKKSPKEGVFGRLQASAREAEARPGYLAKPQEVLAKLKELNRNALEKLIRPHAEVTMTLNFVRGTTFHRDHYNAVTNSKIQNFNLDVWDIIDEYGQDGYALIVDAVATAMDLTDGSLRLFARLPAEEQPEETTPVAA